MQLGDNAKEMLKAFVGRVERLEEEQAALASDKREVYAEAKSAGFDVAVIRKIVALRKQDENRRREAEAVLAVYLHALGMDAQGDLFRANEGEGAAAVTPN